MTVESILFYLLGSVAVGTALGMILQRNPVMSALLLVANFFCIAGLYLTLQQQFLAVIQIVVYTGAIMVLVIFVIMLLNLGDEERLAERLTISKSLGLALVVGFLAELVYIIMFKNPASEFAQLHPDAARLGTVEGIGSALFGKFLFPFEATSVLLLVAVVGAVILAKKRV
ncbi:MAG: NADH-quinone oxidoreductase subunit J [Ignavibacteriae bacterium]|nr:NADH-quinone oxidoreductase subunit J [Ignavibacteriota bacterium]